MRFLLHSLASLSLLLASISGAQTVAEEAGSPSKPNVIIFLVDDMGLMDSSQPMLTDDEGQAQTFPLNEWYRTPNMVRMAKQGVRFSQFYAQSVCSPSRTSILTGQNATRHRTTTWIAPVVNNRGKFGPPKWKWEGLNKEDVTLPRVLAAAGYRSIHVGKAHFGPVGSIASEPLNIGFEVNIGGCAFGQPSSYYGEKNYAKPGKNHRDVPHLEEYHGTETFLTEALTLEAKKEITKSLAAQKPFFLHLAHYAVHSPFNADPRFAENYRESGKPKNAQAFATLIEGIDKSLGDILDHLEATGIAEDTLLFFLGDNGSDGPLGATHSVASSAPLRGKKGTHYEGGMRVPFLVAWGKNNSENPFQQQLPIAKGQSQAQLGTVMDLYPTILALTSTQNPSSHAVDGSDLSTLLKGIPDKTKKENFLMHYPHEHRSSYFTSLREGDWKLVYHYLPKDGKGERYQLFNLKADPYETENLAPSDQEQLIKMLTAMTAQLHAEGALMPIGPDGKTLAIQMPSGSY